MEGRRLKAEDAVKGEKVGTLVGGMTENEKNSD